MSIANQNTELKELLTKLFQKEYILQDNIVALADEVLFHDVALQQGQVAEEIMNILLYLRDIVERNNCKSVQELKHYYAKKHQKIDELAEMLQKTTAEERFAICVQEAFTMHLQPLTPEHVFKSTGIFYPGPAGQHCAVEFDNISYRDSVEEEKVYLARIDGNVLRWQQSKANITDIRSKKILNN